MTRRLGIVLTLAVAFSLSACAGIPNSGAVNEGVAIANGGSSDIEYLPPGPARNVDPAALLQGFIEAASSPQNDFAIAREFLTTKASETWDPSAMTLIDSGVRPANDVAVDAITISVDASAILDAEGSYTAQQAPVHVDLPYSFEQQGGQWRIKSLPPGIVIDQNTFTQVFRQTTLYFVTPDAKRFVPDVRWFPGRAAATTRIVKALLSGPSTWLSSTGAASTAFPAGTTLVADSVPVREGTAVVDLNARGLSASPQALRIMQAQLRASLTQISSVTSVEIQILGNTQIDRGSSSAVLEMMPTVDSRPLVISAGKVGYKSAEGFAALTTGPLSGIDLAGVTGGTLSSSSQRMALLDASGVWYSREGMADVQLADSRVGLLAPGLDDYGFVWSVPTSEPMQIRVTSPSGVQTSVIAPWAQATSITALRMSVDGQRAVAAYADAAGSHVVVASVVRDAGGTPTALGVPVTLMTSTREIVDAVWLDPVSVTVAEVTAKGSAFVSRHVVGGQASTYAEVSSVVALSGGNATTQLTALQRGQILVQPRGTTYWSVVGTKVTALLTVQ